ncbi:hypothetical protein MLD38_029984 [Melastoma candidum]|uniref:Uncharacterized protein n=1 Tax=Melastoma candidum TaxID=119954 RepID=A0ACB9MM65_9MYRT|nr:hypothetical protein MLD38_029984 [Melastoma candidum]
MMGSTRRPEIVLKSASNVQASPVGFRNLGRGALGGVIFGCNNGTIHECFSKQLFGLPYPHLAYVQNIMPGLPLFLFNYSDRKLYGIFEAASHGQMNIDPYGWTTNGQEKTQYPAQVQIRIRMHCVPLLEDQFKRVIGPNYYTNSLFLFELDHAQTSMLISLASAQIASPSSIPKYFPERSTSQPAAFISEARENVQLPRRCVEATLPLQSEKDLVLDKLKDMAFEDDFPILGSKGSLEETATKELEGKRLAGSVVEVQNGAENSQISLESHVTLDQLIRELNELKDFKRQQTEKMAHLESKLAKAETEIQWLKDRCLKLEYASSCSEQIAEEKQLDSSAVTHLDVRESIFLVGGYTGSTWLSSLDSYFPSHDVIKSLLPMTSVRSYASVVKLQNELYVLAGGDGSSWLDTVESYSLDENMWTLQPSLNVKKGSLAGAVVGDKVFALGGGDGLDCFADVEMLDFDIGRWISTRSMTQRRFSLAAVEFNGVIYATGGFDGIEYLNSCERFDPREHSWMKVVAMKSRRACHSLVVLNEKMYAMGGFDGTSMVSTVEVLDPRLDSWMPVEPMLSSRGYSSAAVLGDSIYVIGGLGNEESIVDTVECYKEGGNWHEVRNTAIGKRCFASAISFE